MKLVIFIFIILVSNFTYACINSPSADCNNVQIESKDSSQNEENECCDELCLCNCCNKLSLIRLIFFQNIFGDYSTPLFNPSIQNISGYSSFHWQPPKV